MKPEAPTPAIDQVAEQLRSDRSLRPLGRSALALAAVTLVLFGSTHNASAEQTPPDGSGLQPSPLSVGAAPFETGIATQSRQTDGNGHLVQDMAVAGMTGVRFNISREDTQRDLRIFYHTWPGLKANGINPVLLLEQSPGTSTAGFANWAAGVAQTTPMVTRYIPLNEPNGRMFRMWRSHNVERYANLLHSTDVAIHDVRPDAIVSAAGPDSIEKDNPEGWLRHFIGYVITKYGSTSAVFDTLSAHFYGKPQRVEQMAQEDEGIYNGPINIDETGAIVEDKRQGYDPKGAVSRPEQARYDAQILNWAVSNVQIRNVFFYRLDNPTTTTDIHAGLESPTGTKWPAYFAVKAADARLTTPVTTTSGAANSTVKLTSDQGTLTK